MLIRNQYSPIQQEVKDRPFEQQCKDNLSKFCLKKNIANLQFGRKIIQILNLNFANEIPKSHNYEIIIRGSEYIQMMQTLHHFRSTSFGK